MNDAIKSAIATNRVSNNLCFICLARLNHVITTRKQATPKQERQRSIIAKTILENGVDKFVLAQQIKTLSDAVYPTDKTITIISDIIERGDYSFDESIIPDQWLKYKSAEQIEEEAKRKPIVKKADQTEQDFEELCHYVELEIIRSSLTPDMKKRLQRLKKANYDYSVILQSFKWNKSNINKSIERKAKTEPFKDIYSKFIYICAIIERKLPETLQKIETDKAKELEFWDEIAQGIINGEESLEEAISFQCDQYPDTTYYGRNDYVREQLTLAIERVKTKEQKKREDEKPEPEPEPEHNWDSNCNYQHEAEKPHRYDNLW